MHNKFHSSYLVKYKALPVVTTPPVVVDPSVAVIVDSVVPPVTSEVEFDEGQSSTTPAQSHLREEIAFYANNSTKCSTPPKEVR